MSDFEALYRKYGGDVFRFSFHLCGNREQAEDLTSEAFVRMWIGSDTVRLPTVKSYLFTIARNLFLESLRHDARRVEVNEELPHPCPGPHDQAESSEELRAVLRGLQSLPETDRAALLMRADGLSYEEIAAALKLSLGTVKVRIHRARVRLAQYRISKEKK